MKIKSRIWMTHTVQYQLITVMDIYRGEVHRKTGSRQSNSQISWMFCKMFFWKASILAAQEACLCSLQIFKSWTFNANFCSLPTYCYILIHIYWYIAKQFRFHLHSLFPPCSVLLCIHYALGAFIFTIKTIHFSLYTLRHLYLSSISGTSLTLYSCLDMFSLGLGLH